VVGLLRGQVEHSEVADVAVGIEEGRRGKPPNLTNAPPRSGGVIARYARARDDFRGNIVPSVHFSSVLDLPFSCGYSHKNQLGRARTKMASRRVAWCGGRGRALPRKRVARFRRFQLAHVSPRMPATRGLFLSYPLSRVSWFRIVYPTPPKHQCLVPPAFPLVFVVVRVDEYDMALRDRGSGKLSTIAPAADGQAVPAALSASERDQFGKLPAPLSASERDQFGKLQAIVRKGFGNFVEVGQALKQIRDRELFRESCDSFESWFRDEWNLSLSSAYRQIAASDVAMVVSPKGEFALSEVALRPLAKYKPALQKAIWDRAVEDAGTGRDGKPKITAEEIKHAATILAPRRSPKRKKSKTPRAVTYKVDGAKVVVKFLRADVDPVKALAAALKLAMPKERKAA